MFQLDQMKSVLLGVLGLAGAVSAQLGMTEEWQCGNINLDANGKIINDMDSWLTDHVVNDRFPPNESLSGFVVPTIASPDIVWAQRNCTPLGWANWSPACTEHDACMDAKGTKGVSSDQCNKNILYDWQSACGSAYNLSWDEADLVYGRTASSWGQADKWARIGTKIACAQICANMADLSQKVMLWGMSRTFPALPYTPPVVVPKPPLPTVPPNNIAFVGRVLGTGAEGESKLSPVWNVPSQRFDLRLDWVKINGINTIVDPDEDIVFGNEAVKGNFQIDAKVDALVPCCSQDPDVTAAGLMVRNSLEKGARFFRVATNLGNSEIRVRYRSVENGPVTESKIAAPSGFQRKFRIIKYGNRVKAYYLNGNSAWVALADAGIPWNRSVFVGHFTDYRIHRFFDTQYRVLYAQAYFSNTNIKTYSEATPFLSLLLN